jgi:CDP-paratose 2-epimerase
MSVAVVSGSGGLVGSEVVELLAANGLDVVGIDNNMRSVFFGKQASTAWRVAELSQSVQRYRHVDYDIRDFDGLKRLMRDMARDIVLVVHAAAQPSHDWAATDPATDFAVNAQGTLNLLEALRQYAPAAPFAFLSTNKVYGDRPNRLPLREYQTRFDLEPEQNYGARGIDESMSIDQSMHSVFGASKVAADVMVQEYGRYFGLRTVCFRAGCLTGSQHSSAQLHGFLAYLMRCAVTRSPYRIIGYKGKQVRDNLHASDVAEAIWCFAQRPSTGIVYNLGGGRASSCSVLEAIELVEQLVGRKLEVSYDAQARAGDHLWWITDTSRFQCDYPAWRQRFDLAGILQELHDRGKPRWIAGGA